MKFTFRILTFLLIFTGYIQLSAQEPATQGLKLRDIPSVNNYLYDQLDLIAANDELNLEKKLANFSLDYGSQVLVMLIDSTKPEEIEQYSLRVVDELKIGRGKYDDGVLLLIAVDDRTMRIEVGYGLEGAIPDLTSKIIIDELANHLREEKYYEGIDNATTTIMNLVLSEKLDLPVKKTASDKRELPTIAVFILFLLIMISMFGISKKIKTPICMLLGAAFGSYWSESLQISNIILGALLGGFLSILGYKGMFKMLGMLMILSFILSPRGRGGVGSGSSGGGGGFGRGGFSGGGGGFSGGGGGFGGGGASGRW